MDPGAGRFQSEDLAKSGNNWFVYCNDSPASCFDPSGKDGEMVGGLGVMDIGSGLNAADAMGAVAAAEFGEITLTGEATYMASCGTGTTVDTVLGTYGADAEEIAKGSWEYYKCSVAEMPGTVMKAWLRWDGEEFDAYLKCEQDIDGDAGFASHDSPYVGADSDPDW